MLASRAWIAALLLAGCGAHSREGSASPDPGVSEVLTTANGDTEVVLQSYRPQFKCGRRSKRMNREASLRWRVIIRDLRTGQEREIDLGPGERRLQLDEQARVATATLVVASGSIAPPCGGAPSTPAPTVDVALDA